MEGGVEYGDVRGLRQELARLRDCLERGRVVQRRELDQPLQATLDRVVDRRRLEKLGSAVHDAMADQVDYRRLIERSDRARTLVLVDHGELQACRAGVDDENVAQCGHVQLAISGSSSPWARV